MEPKWTPLRGQKAPKPFEFIAFRAPGLPKGGPVLGPLLCPSLGPLLGPGLHFLKEILNKFGI